jgi:hypothetical protein
VKEYYSMYEEDFSSDDQQFIDEIQANTELSKQSRQIQYEADARNGFPFGPQPKVV